MCEIQDNVTNCFICLQTLSLEKAGSSTGNEFVSLTKRRKISIKFVTLVNKFLKVTRENSSKNLLESKSPSEIRQCAITVCCDLCLPNLKLFCNDYQQLELMQLKIIHTLRGISGLIQSQKSNLEQTQIKNCFNDDNVGDFRENFCTRLENKRRRLFPEVSLERLKNTKNVEAVTKQVSTVETEQSEGRNFSQVQDDPEIFPLSPQKFPEPEICPTEPHDDSNHYDDDFRCYDDNDSFHENDTVFEQEVKVCPYFIPEKNETKMFPETHAPTTEKPSDLPNICNRTKGPIPVSKVVKKVKVKKKNVKQVKAKIETKIFPEPRAPTTEERADPPNVCNPTKAPISVPVSKVVKKVKAKKKNFNRVKDKAKVTVRHHHNHECLICSRIYRKPHLLYDHLRTHLTEKVHHCRVCWKEFQRHSGLAVHKKLHHPPSGTSFVNLPPEQRPRPWICEQCGKSFTSKRYLLLHQIIHKEDRRRYNCDICQKSYMDPSGLTQHNKIVHKKIPRVKRKSEKGCCDICGKLFSAMRDVKRHKARIHKEVNPNEYQFKTLQAERNFKCPVENCGSAFYEQYDLDRHFLRHTGEKPHKCDQCGRCFAQKSALKRHMESHSGVKSFVCKTCGHGFSQRYMLRNHEKIHTTVVSSTSTVGMVDELQQLLS